jgi:hypothetical protein
MTLDLCRVAETIDDKTGNTKLLRVLHIQHPHYNCLLGYETRGDRRATRSPFRRTHEQVARSCKPQPRTTVHCNCEQA